jgi:hypothetical protein
MESCMPHGGTFADLEVTYLAERIKKQRPVVGTIFSLSYARELVEMSKLRIPRCNLPITWRT